MKTCPKCGKYIPDGGKMCIACGWKPEPAGSMAEDRNLKILKDAFDAISNTPEGAGKSAEYRDSELAALGYVGPAFLYSLYKDGDSKLVRYHANQALLLLAANIVCGSLLAKLPLVGKSLKGVCGFAAFILAFLGARNAYSGKFEPVPFIGEFGINIIK